MTDLARRSFMLTAGGITAAALATPWQLALGGPGVAVSEKLLPGALARARAAGKPLLAICIPEDENERAAAGRLWGLLLSVGSHECLADLALCEVVFAPTAELRAARPVAEGKWPADTIALVFETSSAEGQTRIVHGEGIPLDSLSKYLAPNFEQDAQTCLTETAKRLRSVLARDARMIGQRFEQALAVLNEGKTAGPSSWSHYATRPKLAHVDQTAAMARQFTLDHPERRAKLIEILADAAAQRLFERDPEGAQWNVASDYCPPCGMAIVPPLAKHFLELYIEPDGD